MLSRLVLALALTSIGVASPMTCQVPQPVNYVSMEHQTLTLYPWLGRHIVILTPRNDLDPSVMRKIVAAADNTWDYYARVTGLTPQLYLAYHGLGTIAVVPVACPNAAACTYIGHTGMEITDRYFALLYKGVRDHDAYDQVLFYEMGRSFWLYQATLQYLPPDQDNCIVTGFAVLMRYRSMAALGLKGTAEGDPLIFQRWSDTMSHLIDQYQAEPALIWQNTFRVDSFEGQNGLHCPDLFASLVTRLADRFGGETFIQALWHNAVRQRHARSTQDAVDNFVLACSEAAHRDLVPLFRDTWRWPVSAGATKHTHKAGSPPS